MANIILILGHPDDDPNRFCRALAESYLQGARQAGHTVTFCDLSVLDFPLVRSRSDWHLGQEATPPALIPAQQALQAADRIVLIYPLWFGTMPALLKGFLEQVLRPGVALDYSARFPKPLLQGKSARVLVTMSTPGFLYRWYYRAPALKALKRHILGYSGIRPIHTRIFGSIDHISDPKARKWLAQVQAMGAGRNG